MKGIYQKPSTIFNGKIVNIFHLRLEIKQILILSFLFNILLKILAQTKGKKKKHYNNWKESKIIIHT